MAEKTKENRSSRNGTLAVLADDGKKFKRIDSLALDVLASR